MNGRSRRMPGWWAVVLLAAAVAAGCHNTRSPRLARTEPGLDPALAGDAVVVEAPPAGTASMTIVDRHPLLAKPREYYNSSGQNRLVRVGAATLVGIPAGFLGELRQIVRGQPAPVVRPAPAY